MAQHTVHYPMVLPEGYTSRPVTPDDYPALVVFLNEYDQQLDYKGNFSVEVLASEYDAPDFDLETCTQLIFDPNGRLVGAVELWDDMTPPIRNFCNWSIHPELEGSGLEHNMLDWLTKNVERAIPRCPENARIVLHVGTPKGYRPREEVYEQRGYPAIRYFYLMRIDMTEAPAPLPMPENVTIHVYQHPDELEALVEARMAGFSDHWGFWRRPLQEVVEETRHHLATDPYVDTNLFFVAKDDTTGQIVAVCTCRLQEWDDPEMGYIMQLATIPAYRGKGIAQALLHHAFAALWARGKTGVTLHVDASSLTNAVQLYEKVGMHISKISTTYEFVVREGETLFKT